MPNFNFGTRDLNSEFARSRWFKRGWTLQELIAPKHVIFLNRTWNALGTKVEPDGLITKITGIPLNVLADPRDLKFISVAKKLS